MSLGKINKGLHAFLLLGLLLSSIVTGQTGYAQFFMRDEAELFVDSAVLDRTIGIEIEYASFIDDQKVIALLINHFGGEIKSSDISKDVVIETSIGPIRLKLEGSAWRFETNQKQFNEQLAKDLKTAPREVVFPPALYETDIVRMQAFLNDLKALGAKGTLDDKGHAISLQVNLLMGSLRVSQKNVDDLVNLMRVYLKPQHREQSEALLTVPEKRQQYLLDYSPGFMRALLNTAYRPTDRELYDDFMYRQSLELLGDTRAWSDPISVVRERLLAKGEDGVVPAVMKMNKLRVSSLLLEAFPDDPLTKLVIGTRWARPAPIVEFREFNMTFDVIGPTRMALGVTRASQLFGNYDHDTLVSDLTGIVPEDQERLRRQYTEGKKIVRYALQDPRSAPLTTEDRKFLSPLNRGVIQIQLDPSYTGIAPLRLPPGTVVWHRRHIHRATILGEHNPGLENYLLQQVMENKIFEANIFNKYAPGAMPRTKLLKEVVSGTQVLNAEKVWQKLSAEFPNGWVMKGAWDLGTEKLLISDKLDITKAIQQYKQGFEAHHKKVLEQNGGGDPEYILHQLKKHSGFRGWKIMELLKNSDRVFVQERVKIKAELRVESIGGQVLGYGSTVERYRYRFEWFGEGTPQNYDASVKRNAERFVQSILNRLPPELAVLPFGFDVALLEDGSWILIESNAGGNSSLLEENSGSSKLLVEYLNSYPELVKSFKGLLSPEAQMDWIRKHFAMFQMKPEIYYPGVEFGDNNIKDAEYPPLIPKTTAGKTACEVGLATR